MTDENETYTEEPLTETEPASPEDLLNASLGDVLYIEFRERDEPGIPAIRGPIESISYSKEPEHVATLTVQSGGAGSGWPGVFDFILVRDDVDELGLDPAIEADTDAQGPRVIEVSEVECLEIHETRADGGQDQHGERAIYCEEAEQYILGRTEDDECPFCEADLTGDRIEELEEQLAERGVSFDV